MKPSKFRYYDPRTVEEVLDLLDLYGDDAKILAGGQSLIPMLSLRLAHTSNLVDVNRIRELDYIQRENGNLIVGALTRHVRAETSDEVRRACPLITRAMPWIGHHGIRNRGTMGGSLAHADPAAELPAVMTALRATVTAARRGGRRDILIEDLFRMPFMTSLHPTELLTAIRIPAQSARAGSAVAEVARRSGDFALVGVAAAATLDTGGRIEDASLVSFATGPVPLRLHAAEQIVVGAAPDDELFAEAGRVASGEVAPKGDLHASARYRRSVTSVLVDRALREAVDNAGARSEGGEDD